MAKALAGTDFHIYSVEFSPFNASIARRVIQHAGQEHRITVVEGCLGDGGLTLDRLSKEFGCDGVDFVFVDHAKEAYLSDLKLMLERKWLREGTRILADNMLLPGAPSYFWFVSTRTDLFSTQRHYATVEYQALLPDLMLETDVLVR